jgi:hypothetical protein
MKRTAINIRRGFVRMILLTGIMINAAYGFGLLQQFFTASASSNIREPLIVGISLEFAWAALLLWALFSPFERRYILLFTAFAMLTANVLHSFTQFFYISAGVGSVMLNLIMGIVISAIFVSAFFVAKAEAGRRVSYR